MAQFLLKKLKHAYFDGLYIGGVVSNYLNVSKIKKRYFFEYAFNTQVIKRILPSLVIISSTNNYFYVFHESFLSGMPSVGFIDSDLEFFDSFYPILSNNESKAVDFFLLISFSCVIKNMLLKKRLKFLILKLKLIWFCLRFYFYLLCLKFNKINLFYYCFRLIVQKGSIYFNKKKNKFIFERSDKFYKKTVRYYIRHKYLWHFKKFKYKLLKFFET